MSRQVRARITVVVALALGGATLSACTVQPVALPTPSANASKAASPTVSAPPSAATDRVFRGTVQEYADALVVCMVDAGWEASTDPDDTQGPGVITFGVIPAEQQGEWDADNQACQNSLGVLDDAPRTDEELRAKYDWLVGMNACLAAAGYTEAAPPSFESFRDEFATSGTIKWDPIGAVDAGSAPAAMEACPRSTEVW